MGLERPWICRACWKTNRPGDTRCYRCHLPRNADDSDVRQKRGAGKASAAPDDARNALEVLVALPGAAVTIFAVLQGFIFWVNAVVALLIGVLFLDAMVVAFLRGSLEVAFLWFVAASIVIGSGLLWLRLSRAIRARKPWALAVSLVGSLVSAMAGFVVLNTRPSEAAQIDGALWVEIAIGGTAAFLAMIGLLFPPDQT